MLTKLGYGLVLAAGLGAGWWEVRDPDPERPKRLVVESLGMPGDSLPYGLRWEASKRATSYNVTVTASPGAWVGLPVNAVFTDTAITFTAVNATVDSVEFVATVTASNRFGTSPPTTETWYVKRRPSAPGPITVDSSLIITQNWVRPDSLTFAVGEQRQLCAFPEFLGGAVAAPASGGVGCAAIYEASFTVFQRGAVTPAQQARADALCYVWESSDAGVATVEALPCGTGMRSDPYFRVASN